MWCVKTCRHYNYLGWSTIRYLILTIRKRNLPSVTKQFTHKWKIIYSCCSNLYDFFLFRMFALLLSVQLKWKLTDTKWLQVLLCSSHNAIVRLYFLWCFSSFLKICCSWSLYIFTAFIFLCSTEEKSQTGLGTISYLDSLLIISNILTDTIECVCTILQVIGEFLIFILFLYF